MKGAHPHAAEWHVELCFNAMPHLRGRFIGERHCHDAEGRKPFNLGKPRDSLGEYSGFAASRTRKHQGMS